MRPVCRADNLTTFMCWLSWNLGASTSWNPQVCNGVALPLGVSSKPLKSCSKSGHNHVQQQFILDSCISVQESPMLFSAWTLLYEHRQRCKYHAETEALVWLTANATVWQLEMFVHHLWTKDGLGSENLWIVKVQVVRKLNMWKSRTACIYYRCWDRTRCQCTM